MKRAAAKEILWVKTLEEGDPGGEVFPLDERARCTSAVVPEDAIPSQPAPKEASDILSRRARGALSFLTNSHGQPASVPRCHRPWPLIIAGICLVAFAVGLASDRIANHHTINVISAPLLAILAWNLVVYLWNLLLPFLGRRGETIGLHSLLAAAIGIGINGRNPKSPPGPEASSPPWKKLQGNFLARWGTLVGRSDLLTLTAGLHLAAAALALGQVAGLYLGGLVRRYLAVWESTFLDQASFEKLAQILFAPARWLTGIPVEVTAQMEAGIPPPDGGGVPASDWIHLCAATLFLFVVLPRLGLALVTRVRASSAWQADVAGLDLTDYTTGLLRQITTSGKEVAVIACGLHLPENAHQLLGRSIEHAIGKPRSLRFLQGPPYGEEDDYLETLGAPPDIALLVFPLTATPEDETHGLLAGLVSRAVAPVHGGGHTLGILYLDRFEEKLHDLPEYPDRLKEREAVWSRILTAKNVTPLSWDSKAPVSQLGDAMRATLAGT